MKFITPLFLALALSVPNVAAAMPDTREVAADSSAGWMYDIITDLAETFGPNIPTEVSESQEAVDGTRELIAQGVQVQSLTRPHHDGVLLQVAEASFSADGGYHAFIIVTYDDGSGAVEVYSDGERVGIRATDPGSRI